MNQEPTKKLIYYKSHNLFNQKLDIVFYDVTTFYFDSDKEEGFRQKGFDIERENWKDYHNLWLIN